MSPLFELSAAVRTRRADMGLTQTLLAKLSGLSRATVNQVETGTIKDLSLTRVGKLLDALGLWVTVAAPRLRSDQNRRPGTPALVITARTANVSYRTAIGAADLREVLLTGIVPCGFIPHVRTILEEASVTLLAAVVEQLHREDGVERAAVWQRMREMARQLQSCRALWQ